MVLTTAGRPSRRAGRPAGAASPGRRPQHRRLRPARLPGTAGRHVVGPRGPAPDGLRFGRSVHGAGFESPGHGSGRRARPKAARDGADGGGPAPAGAAVGGPRSGRARRLSRGSGPPRRQAGRGRPRAGAAGHTRAAGVMGAGVRRTGTGAARTPPAAVAGPTAGRGRRHRRRSSHRAGPATWRDGDRRRAGGQPHEAAAHCHRQAARRRAAGTTDAASHLRRRRRDTHFGTQALAGGSVERGSPRTVLTVTHDGARRITRSCPSACGASRGRLEPRVHLGRRGSHSAGNSSRTRWTCTILTDSSHGGSAADTTRSTAHRRR